MLDVFNIPGQQDNVKIYYTQGTTAWQTWTKPRNCKFIWIMCIGGGSGGGGGIGFGPNAGVGGGGSGGVVRVLFPANALPDILYVQPGPGGAGGPGTDGAYGTSNAGNRSFVSITPSSAIIMNLVCTSGTLAAGAVNSGTGGSAETIATTAQAGLLSLGNYIAIAGQAGATGIGFGGVSITPLATTITCGGGSSGDGGDGSTAGGSINATSVSPLISGGVNPGNNGGSGIVYWKPLYFLGGAGGAGVGSSTPSTAGGNGGNGAYGCGGGGGGTSATGRGGNGGNGGDGLVIIATF